MGIEPLEPLKKEDHVSKMHGHLKTLKSFITTNLSITLKIFRQEHSRTKPVRYLCRNLVGLGRALIPWDCDLMSLWHDMMPKFIQGLNSVMNVSRERLKGENLLRSGYYWSKLSPRSHHRPIFLFYS